MDSAIAVLEQHGQEVKLAPVLLLCVTSSSFRFLYCRHPVSGGYQTLDTTVSSSSSLFSLSVTGGKSCQGGGAC